ncbi:MAG TPA: hypothetical protein VE982_02475 [Gaiellaceae bacterium]|nr:hypothetical protein [Gaiellaceae bacterium]
MDESERVLVRLERIAARRNDGSGERSSSQLLRELRALVAEAEGRFAAPKTREEAEGMS